MDITVTPEKIFKEFKSVSSKSDFLRLMICGMFGGQPIKIIFNNMCGDIVSAINASKALGANVKFEDEGINLEFDNNYKDFARIDCGESGALLRFLMPCANYFCEKVRFEGKRGLGLRPIKEFINLLANHGLEFSSDCLPFKVSGKIKSGDYFISGNISSQFISGLLFILPVLEGNSRIIITTRLESEKYVDLTIKRLKDFGINVIKEGREIFIPGNQKYWPEGVYEAEGDWSYGAAVLCLGAASGESLISGLDLASIQPDRCIINILSEMGVDVRHTDEGILSRKSLPQGITANLSGCPDLFPVLAALCSCGRGKTIFYGTERLIYKESNRLYSVSSILNSLGADIRYSKNKVEINPVKRLYGGAVSSFGDHRAAMAASIAAKLSVGDVKILNAECAEKSAPGFFRAIGASDKED